MAKNKTVRQHIVPESYLKRFAEDGSLWVFDKIQKKRFPSTPRDAANYRCFYDMPDYVMARIPPDAGLDEQFIEKALGRFEGKQSALLTDLLSNVERAGIGMKYRPALSVLVVIQMMRTKESREELVEMASKVSQALGNVVTKRNFPDIKPEDYPRVTIQEDSVPAFHSSFLLREEFVLTLATALSQLIWTVGINKTMQPFYTSDHPVVRKGNVMIGGQLQLGLKSPGIEIAYPLSSKCILVMRDRQVFTHLERLDRHAVSVDPFEVEKWNSLQVMQSYRQVICEKCEFEQAEGVCRRYPEACNPDRKRVDVEVNGDFIKTMTLP